MPIVRTVRFVARKAERFFVYRVLSLDDTPHRIALGVAIGIFVTWTPTIGLQMVLTVAISALLGANKFVGLPFVWLSNPLTIIPIYGPNYLLGCWLTGVRFKGLDDLSRAITFNGGWVDRIDAWFAATYHIFWELWAGSLIVGLMLGILTYFAVFRAVVLFRRKLHHEKPPQEERPHEKEPPLTG